MQGLEAIVSTVTLSQLLASLTPNFFHAFRFEKLQLARSLAGVRHDISNHRLSLTGETGMAVGKLAKALKVRKYLQDFVQVVIIDWQIKGPQWAKNEHFVFGVMQGFGGQEEGK